MSFLKSSAIVSVWTFGSRILGFLRDIVLANKLGVSAATDAFFMALVLPNLLRRLMAEGAFNVAFVPQLSRENDASRQKAEIFASAALSWLLLISLILVVIAEIFMPTLAGLIAPGFKENPEKFDLLVYLGRISFPYLAFITIAAFLGSVCNTLGRFAAYAAVPALLNISFLGCLFILPAFGVDPVLAATVAIPLGGVFQILFMVWAWRKTGFKLHLSFAPKHNGLKTLLKRIGPAALGIGVLQLSFVIDQILASMLHNNAVSYLQFANRFYQMPLALIGIAMATVLLREFSQALGSGNKTKVNSLFEKSFIGGLALGLASTIGLFLLAQELMSTMFQHGKFTSDAATATAYAMMAYSIGLPAYIITKITTSAFFANEDTRTPVIASVITLVINVIANLILMRYYGHIGIAMATAIAGWSNAALQLYLVKRHGFLDIHFKTLFAPLFKIIAVTACMFIAIVLYKLYVPYGGAFMWKFTWLIGAIGLGSIVFAVGAEKTGLFPLMQLFKSFKIRS